MDVGACEKRLVLAEPRRASGLLMKRALMPQLGAVARACVGSTGYLATMGLFKRNKAASFETGHAGDDQLLTQLAQMSDLTAPRHWVHYLYFPDEAVAREAAEVVGAAGWDLQNVAESAAGGPEWVVIAERHGAVTSPEAVRDARAFFEDVAERWPGGDYDGWEASA
jgi:hypothetical protein